MSDAKELRKREKRLEGRVDEVISRRAGAPCVLDLRPCPTHAAAFACETRQLSKKTLLQAAKALDAIANKIEGAARKNAQEVDRAIALMIKGKREREALARAHLAECAALSEDLEALVKTLVGMRQSSMPALAATIEERIDEVREAVLTEVAALKSRPGELGFAACVQRGAPRRMCRSHA